MLSSSQDWLIIYDNVDEPEVLSEGLIPPDSGHWLITSRSAAIGRVAPVLEVIEFSRGESLELLRMRVPSLDTVEADTVAGSLGDLPLAIEQAGCFLAETGFTAVDYLDLLNHSPGDAGLSEPTTQRHPGLISVVGTSLSRPRERQPVVARARFNCTGLFKSSSPHNWMIRSSMPSHGRVLPCSRRRNLVLRPSLRTGPTSR